MIAANSREYQLTNSWQFGAYQEPNTWYNFTFCLTAIAGEPIYVLYGDETSSSVVTRLTTYTTSKPSWLLNQDLQVTSSNSTNSQSIPAEANKEYIAMSTFTTGSYIYKSLRLYATKPGQIQINLATFADCTNAYSCEAKLNVSTSLNEFNYFYRIMLNVTAGFNFINLTDSTGVPISSAPNSVMTWVSYGGLVGTKWLNVNTSGYSLPSDMVLDTASSNYTSLWNYNSTDKSLAVDRTLFLVQFEMEHIFSSYCFQSGHQYAASDQVNYDVKVYASADAPTPFTVKTVRLQAIKLVCPSTVDTFTDFECRVIMYKPVFDGQTKYEVAVTIGTSPATVIKSLFSTSNNNVTIFIETPGVFTIAANEKYWDTTSMKTVTVVQSNFLTIFFRGHIIGKPQSFCEK